MNTKKIIFIIFLLILIAGAIFFLSKNSSQKQTSVTPPPSQSNQQNTVTTPAGQQSTPTTADFQPPLDRAGERVTKKPFGIYITPQTSPVQPEKFTGYHTGADFEIFSEELNTEVRIHAVCTGKLELKKYASGYGGVAVQSCTLNSALITVIYGHLKLASIVANTGDSLNVGEVIGILGSAYSTETDGERKHLHLGFHKGTAINILGYVGSQSEISNWIDPCLYVCHN